MIQILVEFYRAVIAIILVVACICALVFFVFGVSTGSSFGFLIIYLVLGLVLFQHTPARADAGPHGGFAANTDACAACHRAHSARGAELVVAAVPALCLACHDGSGKRRGPLRWL